MESTFHKGIAIEEGSSLVEKESHSCYLVVLVAAALWESSFFEKRRKKLQLQVFFWQLKEKASRLLAGIHNMHLKT